jgi:hypothetical protein
VDTGERRHVERTGIAALGDEGPREALEVVSLLLLLRFSFLPLAFGLLGLQEALRVAPHVFGSPVLQHIVILLTIMISTVPWSLAWRS